MMRVVDAGHPAVLVGEWNVSVIPALVARYRHDAAALAAANLDAVRRRRDTVQAQDDVTVCILRRDP